MRINKHSQKKMLKARCVSCYNAFQTSSGHHVCTYEAKRTNSKKELIQKGELFSL